MSAPVDLAKLVADAKRWPVDWTSIVDDDGEWTGAFLAVDSHGEMYDVGTVHEIETGSDTDYSVPLGKFLADAVNAIPAIASLTAERDSLRAHVDAQDARIKGLEATLAKVSL